MTKTDESVNEYLRHRIKLIDVFPNISTIASPFYSRRDVTGHNLSECVDPTISHRVRHTKAFRVAEEAGGGLNSIHRYELVYPASRTVVELGKGGEN